MPSRPDPVDPTLASAGVVGGERDLPRDRGVVPPDPGHGGGAATPSFAIPGGASDGLPGRPAPIPIGPRTFAWGSRTYVMGILNVTPDSFSGDGLIAAGGDHAVTGERVRRDVEDPHDVRAASPGERPGPDRDRRGAARKAVGGTSGDREGRGRGAAAVARVRRDHPAVTRQVALAADDARGSECRIDRVWTA